VFAATIARVVILNWLVAWSSGRFGWWLQPAGSDTQEKRNFQGITALVGLYGPLAELFAISAT
jgi:hypothetical protein